MFASAFVSYDAGCVMKGLWQHGGSSVAELWGAAGNTWLGVACSDIEQVFIPRYYYALWSVGLFTGFCK